MAGIDSFIAESAALVTAIAIAVAFDLRRHRIPNRLSLLTFLTGLGWQLSTTGRVGLEAGFGGAIAGFLCFLPFYVRHAMGAGDVKWMASIGSFLGFKGALLAAAFALIAGGVAAAAYVVWRMLRGAVGTARTGEFALAAGAAMIQAQLARRERLPFALPIAIGTIATLLVEFHFGGGTAGSWGRI